MKNIYKDWCLLILPPITKRTHILKNIGSVFSFGKLEVCLLIFN